VEPAAGADRTTASIDLGAIDHEHVPEDLGTLAPGTGLLIVVRGPGAGSRYLVDRDETAIGRHPDAHLLLDDVTVSRRHVTIRRTGEGFEVRDLGSLNGTYVNGERIEDRALVTGDELQVGRFKLLFVGSDGVEDGVDA
jgi:pSer/pThr/pTyr-binding forkhead associated (FHA) protein